MSNPFAQAPTKPFGQVPVTGGFKTGGPPPINPPALPNLLHWFDLTDLSTVWRDSGGTLPAVDGQVINRIDNKGTNGTALDTASTSVPIYRVAEVNGLNVFEAAAAASNIRGLIAAGHLSSSLGAAFWCVFRILTLGTTAVNIFGWFSDHEIAMNAAEDVIVDPNITVINTLALNQWVLAYGSMESNGNADNFFGSPGPEFNNPVANRPDIVPSRFVTLGVANSNGPIIQVAEAGFYGNDLSAADRSILRAYVAGRYPV